MSINQLHAEVMEMERLKEDLSWQISFAEDEPTIEALGDALRSVINHGLDVMREIDRIAKEN